jgi:hypothetical protein
MFFLVVKEVQVSKVFPPVDCSQIDSTYGSQLETYAYYDYEFVKTNPGV